MEHFQRRDALDHDVWPGLLRKFGHGSSAALRPDSHWYVDSNATVSLITKSFAAAKENGIESRAAALQSAMLSLMATKGPEAHPAYWAPLLGNWRRIIIALSI